MDINKFKEKLNRYLSGRSNETESALIEAWYRSYSVDEEQELSGSDEAALRDAIYHKVKTAGLKRHFIHSPFFRIAASLIVIISVAALLIWNHNHISADKITYYTFETGTKGMKKITLPDSSVVWLNAKSRIKVPDSFRGDFRTVHLETGEAFFDIKRDADHPFIVKVDELNVQVWGTTFNVQDYKNLAAIKVVVASGKVGVTKYGHTLAMLLPGQQLSYQTTTGKYQQADVVPGRAQGWKTGYTYLTDADFNELALIVKNIFGLSLKTTNDRIAAYHFTIRLDHNMPANELLKIVGQLHNTHYRKEGNDIVFY